MSHQPSGGRPLTLTYNQVSYTEQVLDNMHVFSFEYSDDLNEFSNFSIDG